MTWLLEFLADKASTDPWAYGLYWCPLLICISGTLHYITYNLFRDLSNRGKDYYVPGLKADTAAIMILFTVLPVMNILLAIVTVVGALAEVMDRLGKITLVPKKKK